jgi:hypothetical protein
MSKKNKILNGVLVAADAIIMLYITRICKVKYYKRRKRKKKNKEQIEMCFSVLKMKIGRYNLINISNTK